MGLGDDIMATADARLLNSQTGKSVRMRYDSVVWENNVHINQKGNGPFVENRPGRRPYIEKFEGKRIIFSDWKATPGDLFLSSQEEEYGFSCFTRFGPYAVIEPNIKGTVSGPNKDWGWGKWESVAAMLLAEGIPVLQFRYKKKGTTVPLLDGVEPLDGLSAREAFGVIGSANLFLGTDGGLHHAAAALNAPAVVVWGGYSSPMNLGYENHLNFADGGAGSPCGNLRACGHCRDAMDRILHDDVADAAIQLWKET